MAREQLVHLGRALEVAIGEPLAPKAGIVDGAALADAGHDVLQDAPGQVVVQQVTHHHGRHPRDLRQIVQQLQAHLVARSASQAQRWVAAAGERHPQPPQLRFEALVGGIRHQDGQQALG